MTTKKNKTAPSKQPQVKAPSLMSEKLENDMKQFVQARLKRGVSYTSAMRQMRRRFTPAINKELATNPESQRRVQKHLQEKQLQTYKPWLRILIRLALFFRKYFKSTKP